MKDKKTVILVTIIIVLLVIIALLLIGFEKKSKLAKITGIDDTKTNITNKTVDIQKVQTFLNNYSNSFSAIFKANSVFNEGSKLTISKNTNYLDKEENKQLFIMTKIDNDEEKINHKNFIIFNSIGEIDKTETCTKCDGSTAYYPYNLFNVEFMKVFNRNFDTTKKAISDYGTSNSEDSDIDYSKSEIVKYEKSNDYVFYNASIGGYNIEISKIEVLNSNYNSTNQNFTSDLKLTYNDAVKEVSGVTNDNAKITYKVVNDNIILESFMIV